MVKFVRRDLIGGTDIRLPATERCQDIVRIISDMIVGTNTGWIYDDRTPVEPTDTYLYIPSTDGTRQFAIKYLVNSVSQAKLMITAYSSNTEEYAGSHGIPKISFKNYFIANNATPYIDDPRGYSLGLYGVNIAMIPADSEQVFPSTFPNDFTTKFIPSESTPIVTEMYNLYSTYNSDGKYGDALGYLQEGNILSYGLLVDSEFIFLFSSLSKTSTRAPLNPKYALGKIIGTLAHTSDNSYISNYGIVRFYNYINYYNYNKDSIRFTKSLNGTNINFWGYDFSRTSSTDLTNRPTAFFFAADKTPITYNGCYSPLGAEVLSSSISNDVSSGETRWCPIALSVMYNPDVQGYYITQGDGFKGYLNTNLFRCAVCTEGNYYNNGDFVGLSNNILVAWDKTATDNLM